MFPKFYMHLSIIEKLQLCLSVALLVLFVNSPVYADFLDMPNIEQMKDLEQKTLLRDMDIPSVKDRSPDPTAGPRLAVSEFRIQGLVEYPELGITREALAELVEGIRFDLMAEGKLLESGYTIEELGELSDLLVDIEEETMDRHVTPLEVQKLVWLIREQRGKRGVTLGQIETVANKITKFYRERGFILAKAYIPKQQVRDGVVNLTLLLGMLGEVTVNGNDLYATDTLKSVFDDMLTKPVTNSAVEENLFIINSFPGISVDGYFEPGYQVGDTKLNINVKSETRYNANIRLDNHGTEESGRYRLYGDVMFNNLLGTADQLHVGLLRAADPSNTTYWQIKYGSNLFNSRFRASLDTSRNQFIVDQSSIGANLDLKGDVDVAGVSLEYIANRGRTYNSNYEFRYEKIKSDLQLGDIPDIGNALDDELTHLSLQYKIDVLDDENKRLHEGNVKYINGTYDFGADKEQEKNYNIFSGDYRLLSFVKVPFTESFSRLILRSNLQYSGTNLSSIVRFSLAGPTRARGFSPSLFTADDSIYLGADWVFNSPDLFDFEISSINFKNFAKPFVFFDYAYGVQHTLIADEKDPTASLADIGFGLQFAHGYEFSGNLMFAFPVLNDFSNLQNEPVVDSSRVVFDFQYSF